MATKNRNHKKQDHKKDHQKDDHENQDHKNKDTPPDLPRIAPLPSEPPASVKPVLPLTPPPRVNNPPLREGAMVVGGVGGDYLPPVLQVRSLLLHTTKA